MSQDNDRAVKRLLHEITMVGHAMRREGCDRQRLARAMEKLKAKAPLMSSPADYNADIGLRAHYQMERDA